MKSLVSFQYVVERVSCKMSKFGWVYRYGGKGATAGHGLLHNLQMLRTNYESCERHHSNEKIYQNRITLSEVRVHGDREKTKLLISHIVSFLTTLQVNFDRSFLYETEYHNTIVWVLGR